MSYGVILKNSDNGVSFLDDTIVFNTGPRGGFCTSDRFIFETINFTAERIYLSFEQFGNVVSSLSTSSFSNINFDMNSYNFYGVGKNISQPTIMQICEIQGYEIGIANTVYSSEISKNQKIIKNFSSPGYIWEISSENPIGFTTNSFSASLSTSYIQNENFCYVKFNSDNITKFFMPVPSGQSFIWYELPNEKFYNPSVYHLTNTNSDFDGTSLNIESFKRIIPSIGESILIDNSSINDNLSGLYEISKIENKIYIKPGALFYNYPGQSFNIKIDIDRSTQYNYISSCYYVPYEYGVPAKPFTKSLGLKLFSNSLTDYANFMPMLKDDYSSSVLVL